MSEVLDVLDEYATLAQIRKPYEAVWDEIDENLLPNVTRLAESSSRQGVQGQKRDEKIIDGTPRSALSTFQAGLMGRLMSSTNDWLAVETPDEDMADDRDTRMWLSKVNQVIFSLINRSSFYPTVYQLFGVAGGMGSGGVYRYFDKLEGKEVFSCRNPWEMFYADGPDGELDTVFRLTIMTAKTMVQNFKDDTLDKEVLRMADSPTEKHNDVRLIHSVRPNPDYDPRKRDARAKKYVSYYVDLDHQTLIRKGGYSAMPYSAWRIEKEVNEDYGRGPGWRALADIKGLYAYAKTDITGAQMQVNGPLNIPREMEGKVQWRPGGRMYFDEVGRTVQAAETRIDLKAGLEREQHKQQIIERHFMVPFFTAMQQIGGMDRERTAYEVRQIEQEMAILLGPYAMGFQVQFMDSIVEGIFNDALENGMIPPPPRQLVESLNGRKLEISYSGPLAQAQKNFFNSEPYRKTIQDIQAMLSVDPTGQHLPSQIMDIPDWDRFLKELAQGNGLPIESLLEDKTFKQIRKQRADAIQKQQQLDAIQKMGGMQGVGQAPQPGSIGDAIAKQAKGQPVASGQ